MKNINKRIRTDSETETENVMDVDYDSDIGMSTLVFYEASQYLAKKYNYPLITAYYDRDFYITIDLAKFNYNIIKGIFEQYKVLFNKQHDFFIPIKINTNSFSHFNILYVNQFTMK